MRLALVLLLVPLATAQWPDGADDQTHAPAYKAWDVAFLDLRGNLDDSEGLGVGLVWGIGFHPGVARSALPHPDLEDVQAFATLGNVSTEMTQHSMCLSFPPACFQGAQWHASFGPDACVFTDIHVELRDDTLIDRVPDAGGLTYDACWVFGQAPAEDLVFDVCGDQGGAPRWSHGDLRWLNATTSRHEGVFIQLDGNIRDCGPAAGDPTASSTTYEYRYRLGGEQHVIGARVCESLPVACIQASIELREDACLASDIVLVSLQDDGTVIDRIPDHGGFSISGCHLFASDPPANQTDPDSAPDPPEVPPDEVAPNVDSPAHVWAVMAAVALALRRRP